MAFSCCLVVGYFDPIQVYGQTLTARRPLDVDTVVELQSVCDSLYGAELWIAKYLAARGVELRLADYLSDQGLLVINGIITPDDMFRIGCVAHEFFGMSAVDSAHREGVYPKLDWKPGEVEGQVALRQNYYPERSEACIREEVEAMRARQRLLTEFEEKVVARVCTAREQKLRGLGYLSHQ